MQTHTINQKSNKGLPPPSPPQTLINLKKNLLTFENNPNIKQITWFDYMTNAFKYFIIF